MRVFGGASKGGSVVKKEADSRFNFGLEMLNVKSEPSRVVMLVGRAVEKHAFSFTSV